MELIESQAEICYQLFISAVETMAGAVLEGWEPDTKTKLASKGGLVSYATKKEGLSREVAERLALEASRGNPWSSRKFKKFFLDNLDRGAIRSEDKLFIVPQEFCPKDDDEIEKALGEVYKIRSGATHSGLPYPDTPPSGHRPAPFKAWSVLFTKEHPFPPIGWFERVVNNAICNFLRRELAVDTPAQQGDRGFGESPSAHLQSTPNEGDNVVGKTNPTTSGQDRAMHEVTQALSDKFEVKGYWWLPGNPVQDTRCANLRQWQHLAGSVRLPAIPGDGRTKGRRRGRAARADHPGKW